MKKYISFIYEGKKKYGYYIEDRIHCIRSLKHPIVETDEIITFSEKVKILPIKPEKIICIGLNYKSHAEEFHQDIPLKPVVFSKTSNTVSTNNQAITLPGISSKIEFEGEIGVIIGSCIHDVDECNAGKSILGIVPINDVTARDYQEITGQWLLAKSFDGFLPIGNQILEYTDTTYTLEVYKNGELKQRSDSTDLIFTIPFLVSYLSKFMTLNPGDLICTGTPSGEKIVEETDVVEVVINQEVSVKNYFVRENYNLKV